MSYLPFLVGAIPDELAVYDSTTPTTLGYLGNYRDGIDALEYQILASGAFCGSQATSTAKPGIYLVGGKPRNTTTS